MTKVSFYYNLPDKIDYACRLIRKIRRRHLPVGVVAPAPLLAQLDTGLWTFSQLDFIAHCRVDQTPDLTRHSAVVLAPECASLTCSEVLVSLQSEVPAGFERFAHLAELVADTPEDKRAARVRWHYYAERGYAITAHDIASPRERA